MSNNTAQKIPFLVINLETREYISYTPTDEEDKFDQISGQYPEGVKFLRIQPINEGFREINPHIPKDLPDGMLSVLIPKEKSDQGEGKTEA